MKFYEKLRKARADAGLSQEELARRIRVSPRTLQNYESGKVYPKSREVYSRIAQEFQMDVNYWLSENEEFLLAAAQQYGGRGAKQAQELLDEVNGLFAGGDLADEDLDEMMKAIQLAYWRAKEKNKKYTPKKYRKTDSEAK